MDRTLEQLRIMAKKTLDELEVAANDDVTMCHDKVVCPANKKCATWGTLAINKFDELAGVVGETIDDLETQLAELKRSVVEML